MKVKREQNIIEYGSKTVKLDELLAELASKDSKEVAKYLVENTSLPRELRTNALRLVLNDYVKMAKELDLSDEFMYRLNWYEKFSEYQLVNFWNILVTKNSIFHCVYAPQLSYPFVCQWTSRLLPCPGYCKQCCVEH